MLSLLSESSLVELKSQRALLEIQLLGLRRREGTAEIKEEIARCERLLGEIDEQIEAAEAGDAAGAVHHVTLASLQASAELERIRSQILETLRSLAEPLREYQRVAERQKRLTARIRQVTGKDNSYAAYIDTALLRTSDYDAEIESVIETLRRTPVVQ